MKVIPQYKVIGPSYNYDRIIHVIKNECKEIRQKLQLKERCIKFKNKTNVQSVKLVIVSKHFEYEASIVTCTALDELHIYTKHI